MEAATEDNRRGLEAATDMLGQGIDTSLSKMKEETELRNAADRVRLLDAIEASEARVMKMISGMLRHTSEEGKRRKEETSKEIEMVRKIVHKSGSVAEDIAGSVAELITMLRENGRGRRREETEEEVEAEGCGHTEGKRGRNGRAPSPDEGQSREGPFSEWTSEQRQEWAKRNPLIVSRRRAEGSPCEVLKTNPGTMEDTGPASPAMTLPSRLSSIILTPTPVTRERTMPGAFVQQKETTKTEIKRKVVETDSEESSTDGEEINRTQTVRRWKSGIRVGATKTTTTVPIAPSGSLDRPATRATPLRKSPPSTTSTESIPIRAPEAGRIPNQWENMTATKARVSGPPVSLKAEGTKLGVSATQATQVTPAVPQVTATATEQEEKEKRVRGKRFRDSA